MAKTTIVIKSGTRWFVPPDCKTATVQALGGGGGVDGGGGSWAKSTTVNFTPGTFVNVSVGAGGSPTWINADYTSSPNSLSYVQWSGSQYVAWNSYDKEIYTSTDSITWTKRAGITTLIDLTYGSVYGVASFNSKIVAIVNNGSQYKLVYYDGSTWSNGSIALGATSPSGGYFTFAPKGVSIQCVNGVFFYFGITTVGSVRTLYTSSDGATWTAVRTNPFSDPSPSFVSIPLGKMFFDGTNYIIPGQWNDPTGFLSSGYGYSTSANGPYTLVYAGDTYGVVYGNINGNNVYVRFALLSGSVSSSSSLSGTWTSRTLPGAPQGISSVVFNGTKFIAYQFDNPFSSSSGSYLNIYTSTDGSNWVAESPVLLKSNIYGYSTGAVTMFNVGSTVYASGGNYFSQSTNSGGSWTKLASLDGSPLLTSKGVVAPGGAAAGAASTYQAFYVGTQFNAGGPGGGYYSFCNCGFLEVGPYGGGGGAGGPRGPGGKGGSPGTVYGSSPGGGGGGANLGTNGGSATTNGGAGGAGGAAGSTGGNGGVSGTPQGGNGTNGGGGGGSLASQAVGGAGSQEAISEWTDFAGNIYGAGGGGGGGSTGWGAAGGYGAGGSGSLGQGLIIITYTPVVTAASGPYTQVVTSNSDVYLPAGVTTLTVHAIGPGSNGGKYAGTVAHGGGGGAYSNSSTSYTYSTSGTRAYAQVPPAQTYGSTADTWFQFTVSGSPTAPGSASAGVLAKGASSNIGGLSTASVGVAANGGNGGNSFIISTTRMRGGGGAGAGGPGGVGRNGGAASTSATAANGAGGGGGGTNGGTSTAGLLSLTTTGGAGGAGPTGTAGGAGAIAANSSSGTSAVAGTNGSGGGGGAAFANTTDGTTFVYRDGANGSQYGVWTVDNIVYGPGAGGGGAGQPASSNTFGNGGYGIGYGAGGGAASAGSSANSGTAGIGGGGLVVFTYFVTTVVGAAAATGNFLAFF